MDGEAEAAVHPHDEQKVTPLEEGRTAFRAKVLRIFFKPFFDPNYLRGKWFDGQDMTGWKWAWRAIFAQKIRGVNRSIPWPCNDKMQTDRDIDFHPDDINNFQIQGGYFQTGYGGRIVLGYGTHIGPGVGLITSNHDPNDPSKHLPAKGIDIGKYSWIGMNSVILPGVVLGPHTVVGTGSVVTKSFPEGYRVIAGNPAKVIRLLAMEGLAEESSH